MINKKLYIHYTDRAGCSSQVFIDISKKKQEHSDYKGLLHTFGQEVDSRPFCHELDTWTFEFMMLSGLILKGLVQPFSRPRISMHRECAPLKIQL